MVFFSEWTGIGCVLLFDHFSLAINIRASPWQIDSNFLQKPWYSEKLGKKKQWCSKMKIHSVINSNEKNSCEIMYHWNIHINYLKLKLRFQNYLVLTKFHPGFSDSAINLTPYRNIYIFAWLYNFCWKYFKCVGLKRKSCGFNRLQVLIIFSAHFLALVQSSVW